MKKKCETYHEVGIANMMLNNTSSENNHASLLCKHCLVVHLTNVCHKINNQPGTLVRMEINHVTQGSVRQGRTKDWDVILETDNYFFVDQISYKY